jgi:hypothetical protein
MPIVAVASPRCSFHVGAVLLWLALASGVASGQPAPVPAPKPFPPAITPDQLDRHTLRIAPLERVGPGQFRMGVIELNRDQKSVSFPAVVNMDKGLLEYVLVRTTGKTHESLLRTDIEPYSLQVACLFVGMEGTSAPLAFQGDPAKPKGDAIELTVTLTTKDGATKSLKPEAWVSQEQGNARRDSPVLDWVFTGSVVNEGRLAAQLGGSIVALYHDPAAMVDNASPGGESDKIWFVKEGAVPPVGTPVKVTLRLKR